jgi:hypothetical protein
MGKAGIEWVMIPGGSFMMGFEGRKSDEKPAHRVKIEGRLNNFSRNGTWSFSDHGERTSEQSKCRTRSHQHKDLHHDIDENGDDSCDTANRL